MGASPFSSEVQLIAERSGHRPHGVLGAELHAGRERCGMVMFSVDGRKDEMGKVTDGYNILRAGT